jgi:lipopolysaccharide/colanic/teichoic acid biosynthesis glycosyltransferase
LPPCGLIILSPVFLVVAILTKIKMRSPVKGEASLTGPNPVFFVHQRVGQHGKLFRLVKFRTMTINHGGNSISIKGENRITPLGRMLRKYKLDELPELWNVLKCEMSIVEPRPDVPGYADKLEGEDRKVLLLKPGITSPASMKYSNEEEILLNKVIAGQKLAGASKFYRKNGFVLAKQIDIHGEDIPNVYVKEI